MTYIIFEGPDGSGKTSTLNLVKKFRNQEDNILDRFIGSMIVYGKIFGRYGKRDIYSQYFQDYIFNTFFTPILIYLYAPVDVLIKRLEKNGHEKIDKKVLGKALKEFDKYYEKCCYTNKLKIDTSKYSQKEVVRKIIKFLKICSK